MTPLASITNTLTRVLRRSARGFEKLHEKQTSVVHLRPEGTPTGHAILYYLTDPWLYPKSRDTHYHTNRWECAVIAETFVEAGYSVEVVDYLAKYHRPRRDCSFVIDTEHSLEAIADQLSGSCTKIYHAPTTHWLHWNRAELRRLHLIQQRRGVALLPRRQLPPNRGIELADLCTYVGNSFTGDTYRFAGKPLHRIPISTVTTEERLPSRDIARIRKRFLWFGSVGVVHKGLDLVLEAFARMPDLELSIAGAIHLDTDFVKAYDQELNHTRNIRNLGWIDATSPDFHRIMSEHIGVVYPSCAEGGAGSVICCMHSGVIPVVTTEASIDSEDFGFRIESATPDAVMAAVRSLCDLSDAALLERSRASWEHVRRVHSRAHFLATYRDFARRILKLPLRDDPVL